MSFASLLTRIASAVDWFIHPSLRSDRDRVNQARVFLISHLFGPFIGSAVPIALYAIDPTPGFEIAVLTASIMGFWLFPPLLKKFGNYNLLAILSVENLIFCILWSCYFYGGVKSPTLPWVLTIPLLAFFYIGPSNMLRTIVIGLFAANMLVFVGVSMFLEPPINDLPTVDVEWLAIISTVAVALYVTMMALYYAKVYESQAELESEMREHLETAAELRRATNDAERAGAAKAEFLAKMSHELRTPLNAVINYSEILLEDARDEGDEEISADLTKIHSAGKHLLKLINEVLDLSKIDAGMMTVYNEFTNVPELIRQAVDEIREAAEAHSNVLNVDIDPEFSRAYVDQQKLQQIIAQTLENAVKFTKGGIVSVYAYPFKKNRKDCFAIEIRDTGIGIAEDELPRLFEHFTVLGDASSSKYGGTGLGLALSLRLARLMSGDLSAKSKLGEGSTFTITLPVYAEEGEKSKSSKSESTAEKTQQPAEARQAAA